MDALLTAIVVWLSVNFNLPASYDHPHIQTVAPAEIAALHFGESALAPLRGTQRNAVMELQPPEIAAAYHDMTRTIYLPEDWTGTTAAELSVLVHEMVHHLQNVAGLTYSCPAAREKLAFAAQEQWLESFGSNLETEFGLDSFAILVKTVCGY